MKAHHNYDLQDLWEKDRRHAVHGWTDFSKFGKQGSEILFEADGLYVTDLEGRSFMDAMAGVWCVNIGYGRTEVVDAIQAQAHRLPYANPFRATTTPPAVELTAQLADLAPGDLDHVLFSGGGSTANDSALRIVQLYFNGLGRHDKKQIICRTNAYHGSTSASAALCGIASNKVGFDLPDLGVHYLSAPYDYRRPEGVKSEEFCDYLVKEFEDLVERIGPDRIACFYAETVMGMGGVLVPPPGYFQRISEVCKSNDILIIADEVVTGFGRIGEFFASDLVFEMSPDIVTCAKGLTSGYLPLGATIISSRIMDVLRTPFEEGAIFSHGFTYAEHPVCCAAALANIAVLEREGICQHVKETSEYLRSSLETLLNFELIGDVRGAGFMFAIEIVADKRSKELFPPAVQVGNLVTGHARKLGLIVRSGGHIIILSPPLIMRRDDIDFLVNALREAIQLTQNNLNHDRS